MNCYYFVFEGSFSRTLQQDIEGFFAARYVLANCLNDAQKAVSEGIILELRADSPALAEALIGLEVDEYHIAHSDDYQQIKGFTFF